MEWHPRFHLALEHEKPGRKALASTSSPARHERAVVIKG